MQYLDALAFGNKSLSQHLKRRPGAPKSFASWPRKHIGPRHGIIFLAEVDGKSAGYSFIYIRRTPGIKRINTLGYIEDLFVKEEFRGEGISSRLMDQNMKWFLRKKVRHISLHVLNENQVPKAIYRKWGFFPFVIEMRKDLWRRRSTLPPGAITIR